MRKSLATVIFLALSCLLRAASFTNGQAAWAVIGQNEFTYGDADPEGNKVGAVSGLAFANGLLFVDDASNVGASPSNNRILIFPTFEVPSPYSDLSSASHPSVDCWVCGYYASTVLGQPDFVSTNPGVSNQPTSTAGSLLNPQGIATDGKILAVSDTGNNRVLIWNSIPSTNAQPANIVLGTSNFTTAPACPSASNGQKIPSASSLCGPQGLWIQNGKLFVADPDNYRVLIWNHIPTQNNQPADVVLGQPNFTTGSQPACDPTKSTYVTSASELCNPVSVTSDGTHLFVSDLGFNRVLIWNSIPTTNNQPADVVVGQPDMVSAVPNNAYTGTAATSSTDSTDHETPVLCTVSNGTDPYGNPTYPSLCEKTLNFPRYAFSDGTRLFIADGGNDRVLIFNSIPQSNGAGADVVLGQPDFVSDIITNQATSIVSTAIDNTGSVDTIPTPMALAWDGTNLYVSDPYNRRVLLFTESDTSLPDNSVLNWASEIIRQEGIVVLSLPAGGSITANDTVTISIQSTNYTYTIVKNDTLDTIAQGLVNVINSSNSNSGDPNATAIFGGTGTGTVYLSSKGINLGYDTISLSATTSNSADITATASGGYLSAGTGATGAAGMLVEIDGSNLSDASSPVAAPLTGNLPTNLAGAQVFMDGIPTPLMSVSSSQIITQIPYWFGDRNSVSIFVRTTHNDGSVTITNATPMYVAPANPGIFNAPSYAGQPRPWPTINAYHQPTNPTAVVSIDGTVHAGDVATITINNTAYNYTVQSTDTLSSIVTALVNAINGAPDPYVQASAGGAFTRVVLTAYQSGAAGTGIPVAGSASSSAQVTVTAYSSGTCCAVVGGSLITTTNPAVPGELITVSTAGLGLFTDPNTQAALQDGQPYNGPFPNDVANSVSATMNGETAEVIFEQIPPGSYGVYQVQMIVPTDLTANSTTQLNIAQNAFISNTVTIPVSQTPGAPQGPPGSGISSAQILVNPLSLVFANQNLGNPSLMTQTVTIQNPGSAVLGINNVQVAGPNAINFRISSSSCGTSLAAGSNCTVSITYTPVGTGIQTASLVVASTATVSPQIITLTGATVSSFEILNQLSGLALDVSGGSTSPGAAIVQSDISGLPEEQWSFVDLGNGYYSIMNMNSGNVLDVTGASTSDGALIQQYNYLGGTNQMWSFMPAGNGYYAIVNLNSGMVLDVTGLSTSAGTILQQWDYTGNGNQLWSFVVPQYYQIVNVNSGDVLDDPSGTSVDGTIMQQWQNLNGPNQVWQLLPLDNTYYAIINKQSGKCLDVVGGSNNAGTLVQEYDFLNGDNQRWALQPVGNGTYAIVGQGSGRVLDVMGASTANGTQIQIYDFLGGSNQLWQLIPVGTPGQY